MKRAGVKKPEGHPAVREFLTHPRMRIGVDELAAFFRVTRVTFTFGRPADLDTGLRLPAALRGALGRQIKRLADRNLARGDEGPQLWHAMFADCRWPGRQRHFPKPFVIWITPRGRRIYVEISLFGDAGAWRDDLIEAMLGVMTPREKGGEGGVTLDGHTRARRIWPVRDIYWRVREGFIPPAPRKFFVLSTITPIITGSDMVLQGSHTALFASLLYRLGGLARWHGLDVPELNGPRTVLKWCRRIKAEPLIGPKAARYERRSRTFGKYAKPENGILGHFMIREYPQEIWPCLTLGTLTNMGYSIPQGAGRYIIA